MQSANQSGDVFAICKGIFLREKVNRFTTGLLGVNDWIPACAGLAEILEKGRWQKVARIA